MRELQSATGDRGQLQVGEMFAGVLVFSAREVPGLHRHTVVKEDGVDVCSHSVR